MPLTGADLGVIARDGAAADWVAERSRAWLAWWREDIGQHGFFPFDLVAAAYLLHPELFRCAEVQATIEPHTWIWRWRLGAAGLFVDQRPRDGAGPKRGVIYCPRPQPGAHAAALADLTRGP